MGAGKTGSDEIAAAVRVSKSARTRRRILDAAAHVFREQGYSNARLSDIAEMAGIQTGSLYYHFAGREELVAELLRLGVETARHDIDRAIDALPARATSLDRLTAAVRAHTLAVLDRSDYASAQARIGGQVPTDIRRKHHADVRAFGDYWRALFENARDDGFVRDDLNMTVVRLLTLGGLNFTSEWFDPDEGEASEIADAAAELLLRGLQRERDPV